MNFNDYEIDVIPNGRGKGCCQLILHIPVADADEPDQQIGVAHIYCPRARIRRLDDTDTPEQSNGKVRIWGDVDPL